MHRLATLTQRLGRRVVSDYFQRWSGKPTSQTKYCAVALVVMLRPRQVWV